MGNILQPEPVTGLPLFDGDVDNGKSLLIVLLGDLGNAGEAKVVQYFGKSLENANIRTWRPSEYILRSVAKPGQYKDSQANIYGLAILAYRSGWSGFIVADGLTKRQMNGDLLPRYGVLPSVVMVAMKPGEKEDENLVRVITKRTTGTHQENVAMLSNLKTLDVPVLFKSFATNNPQNHDLHSTYGLELYDPDRSAFSKSTATATGREELLAKVDAVLSHCSLPVELRMIIISLVNDEDAHTIEIPPVNAKNGQVLPIFLLFPTTTEELDQIQSTVQNAIDTQCNEGVEMSVHLIPWKHPHIASRRDLLHIWKAYALQTENYKMDVLFKPINGGNVDSAQFGTVYSYEGEPSIVICKSLGCIIKEAHPRNTHTDACMVRHKLNNPAVSSYTEILGYGDSPFYPKPPPWLPADTCLSSVASFYPTSKPTNQQQGDTQGELLTRTKAGRSVRGSKIYCFAPGKSGDRDEEEDGSLRYRRTRVCKVRPSRGRRVPRVRSSSLTSSQQLTKRLS